MNAMWWLFFTDAELFGISLNSADEYNNAKLMNKSKEMMNSIMLCNRADEWHYFT